MNNNRNVMYAVVAVAGVAIAVLAGVPAYFLLLVACPVMMLFMMSSMSGGTDRRGDGSSSRAQASETKLPDDELANPKAGRSTP